VVHIVLKSKAALAVIIFASILKSVSHKIFMNSSEFMISVTQ
jgi:hypothetical protein